MAEKGRRAASLTGAKIDPHAMRDAVKMYNHFRAVWKQRKELVVEAVDIISDGMGKKMAVVMSEMGVETGTVRRFRCRCALLAVEPPFVLSLSSCLLYLRFHPHLTLLSSLIPPHPLYLFPSSPIFTITYNP